MFRELLVQKKVVDLSKISKDPSNFCPLHSEAFRGFFPVTVEAPSLKFTLATARCRPMSILNYLTLWSHW